MSDGPVQMYSCRQCSYHKKENHYEDDEVDGKDRYCMYGAWHYSPDRRDGREINEPGNETPEWCPLLESE